MASCQHNSLSSIVTMGVINKIDEFFGDYIKAFDNKTMRLEDRFVKLLIPYFDEQEQAVLKALRKKSKGVSDASGVFDAEYWDDLLRETLKPIYDDIILTGGDTAAVAVSGSFDVLDPNVLKLKGNKLANIVDINNTTQSAIKKALQAGIKAGDSIDLLSIRIQKVFGDITAARARMIARTEVIGGYNGAANETYVQNDVVKNQWLSTLDDRTREDHQASHMQVANVKTGFSVSGELLLYPGDPSGSPGNIINCRCTTIAIIK